MKQIFALCLTLLLPLPALAQTADLNLYLSYWPEGAEDAGQSMNLEYEAGQLAVSTYDVEGNETSDTTPADPAFLALMVAGVQKAIGIVSPDMGTEYTGPAIVVEWSVSSAGTFARGNSVIPLDGQPAEFLAIQDQIFGARLAADVP